MTVASAVRQNKAEPTYADQDISSVDDNEDDRFFDRLPEPYTPSGVAQAFKPNISVARRPPREGRAIRLIVTQEWEGFVTEVVGDDFYAEVQRIGSAEHEVIRERMVFNFDDETMGDKDLIVPGGVFRWLIGYLSLRGTHTRASQVIFRRLPGYTKRDEERVAARVSDLQSFFHAE